MDVDAAIATKKSGSARVYNGSLMWEDSGACQVLLVWVSKTSPIFSPCLYIPFSASAKEIV